MTRFRISVLLTGMLAAGCTSASDVDVLQSIVVQTPGADGAECILTSDKGDWKVGPTPGTVEIRRGAGTLYVRCLNPGYSPVATTLDALPHGIPWQNIFSGGFFGGRAEDASDTAYEYPSLILLPMKKSKRVASVPDAPKITPAQSPREEAAIDDDFQLMVSEPAFLMPEKSKPADATTALPVVRAPSPVLAAPPRKISKPQSRLLSLRLGVHDNFVRLVLDLDKKSEYETGFDRQGRVVIRLPGVKAKSETKQVSSDYSPVTNIVTTSPDEDGGTSIKVATRSPVSVKAFDLTPDRVGGHRIVVDLVPNSPSGG